MSRSPSQVNGHISRSASPASGRENGTDSRRSDRSERRDSPRDSRSPPREKISLYISGLASKVTDADLLDHFKGEGKIKEARVVLDPRTRDSRGFGFVDYEDARDAEKAINYLDRSVLLGRIIVVEKAKRGRPRTPTPGEYRGVRLQRDLPPPRHERHDRYDRGRSYYDRYERRRSPSPYYSRARRSPPPYYRRRSPSPYRSRRSRSRSPY